MPNAHAVGNTACYDRSCSEEYAVQSYHGQKNFACAQCDDQLIPKGFQNGSAYEPIGIALDGYVIFGPYNYSGGGITGLDNCNGKYVDGSYRYYATDDFPYLVG